MVRVAHITSVHRRTDTRIFYKQARALQLAGFEVHLLVADGHGDEFRDGIAIHDVGAYKGRVSRILRMPRKLACKAKQLGAKLYHLHDPELLTIIGALKRSGASVIFDSHEDIAKDILSKAYLPAALRPAVSAFYSVVERLALRDVAAVVAATPAIKRSIKVKTKRVVTIQNYPLLSDCISPPKAPPKTPDAIAYVGDITSVRGIKQLVAALPLVGRDVTLLLAGVISEPGLKNTLVQHDGWRKVKELGHLPRSEVHNVLARAQAGMVTFLPAPNHMQAQPNKMFEYMAAGLPVVASNFPEWQHLINKHACGFCVNPLEPSEIASAIDQILNQPSRAAEMGSNGREAVRSLYNWESQASNLIELYKSLL